LDDLAPESGVILLGLLFDFGGKGVGGGAEEGGEVSVETLGSGFLVRFAFRPINEKVNVSVSTLARFGLSACLRHDWPSHVREHFLASMSRGRAAFKKNLPSKPADDPDDAHNRGDRRASVLKSFVYRFWKAANTSAVAMPNVSPRGIAATFWVAA